MTRSVRVRRVSASSLSLNTGHLVGGIDRCQIGGDILDIFIGQFPLLGVGVHRDSPGTRHRCC